jgi:hypothetical protein
MSYSTYVKNTIVVISTNPTKCVSSFAYSHACDARSADSRLNTMNRVGTRHHVMLQSNHQLMTPGMVHVTNLTPGSDASTLVGRMGDNTS